MSKPIHTPNGYDPTWLAAINRVLEDRESEFRITDLTDDLWDSHIGPMIDAIEDSAVNLDGCTTEVKR
jgi:hypothetical protein